MSVDRNLEGYWERAYNRTVPKLLEALADGPHVPTPDELDQLLSDISAAGYASEAREIVENWTRKWWGVESAFTTKWDDPKRAE